MIAVANAEVDEDAMVVGLGDAALAEATVLGARWLEELARLAVAARVEDGVVIRVQGHVVSVCLGCYEARVAVTGEVKESIRRGGNKDGD